MPNPNLLPEEFQLLLKEYNSDECTDERRAEIELKLEEIGEHRDALLQSLLVRHADLTGEIEGDKYLIKKYTDRKGLHEMQQQGIERFANSLLSRFGLPEFKCDLGKINYRKSTAVVLDKDFVIIDEWARIIPEKREADKRIIADLLKAGKTVPGASIEQRMNIQFAIMPYVQRKLNASRYDLTPEQFPDFVEVWEGVCASGLARSIREPVIIQCLQDFGKDKLLEGIRGLIGRANWSADTLQGLLDGSIPRERQSPVKDRFASPGGHSERPGRYNRDSRGDVTALQSLLNQAAPKPDPDSQPQYRAHAQKSERYFNENQCLAWMNENGHANSEQDDGFLNWFDQAGVNGQTGETIYKLKK